MLKLNRFFNVETIPQYRILKYISEYFDDFEVDIQVESEDKAVVRFLDGTYFEVYCRNNKTYAEFYGVPFNIHTMEQLKIYRHIRNNFFDWAIHIEWLSGNKAKISDENGDTMTLMCNGKNITADFEGGE